MDKEHFYLQVTSFLLFLTLWLVAMEIFLGLANPIINLSLIAICLILSLMLLRLKTGTGKSSSLMKEYERETGKHALWHGKITSGFKSWKKKRY